MLRAASPHSAFTGSACTHPPLLHSSQSDPYADDDEYDYEIYSKIWDAGAQATLRQKGEEARRAPRRPVPSALLLPAETFAGFPRATWRPSARGG